MPADIRWTLLSFTYAKDNGIAMIVLPPHCTHKMQLLDKTFFGPLKTNYNAEAEDYEIAQLFGSAYIRTVTMQESVRGFECTGIWPFNPKILNDDDYASSLVTDEPPPAITTPSSTESLVAGPPSTLGIVSGSKNGEATERPTKSDTPGPKPTPGYSDVIAVVNMKGIIRSLFPLPVRQLKRNRKRKAETSIQETARR